MTLTVPLGSQNVEPLGVISEESSKEVEEEKVLFTSTCPATKPSGLFAPDTPLALTCHDTRDPHAAHHAIASKLCCGLNFFVHHEGIGLQSQGPPAGVERSVAETSPRRLISLMVSCRRRHAFWRPRRFELGQYPLLYHVLQATESTHNDVPVLPYDIDTVIDITT